MARGSGLAQADPPIVSLIKVTLIDAEAFDIIDLLIHKYSDCSTVKTDIYKLLTKRTIIMADNNQGTKITLYWWGSLLLITVHPN